MEGHNERNYLLLHRLLLYSTRVLLAKFEKSLIDQGTTLQTWQPAGRDLKEAKLSNIQISNIKQRRADNFDIGLLIYLLRNFGFKSDKSNLLWNETDNNKIQNTGDIADIVRIRNLRNMVCVFFCTLNLLVNDRNNLCNFNFKNALIQKMINCFIHRVIFSTCMTICHNNINNAYILSRLYIYRLLVGYGNICTSSGAE